MRILANAFFVMFSLLLWQEWPAHAEQSTFRVYDSDQGLTSAGGTCMLQDRAGYILVCTEHGVFAYDGRRFANLGPDQGLREGGNVYGLALTSQGRIAVSYSGEVMISDRATDSAHAPGSLVFHQALHPGISFSSIKPHRLVPWLDGFVLIADDTTVRIVVPGDEPPHVESMAYDPGELLLLKGALSVFSVRGHLWEAFQDGRLCAADPGAVRCFTNVQGSRDGRWIDVVAGSGNTIVARSASSVATFDPGSGRWEVVALPDHGDRYLSYTSDLSLFRTPDGRLATQIDHGLAVLGANGWRALRVEDGAPSGTIVSALTDADGQFWFQDYGRGLVRSLGYGHWQTIEKADGLSDGVPWMSAALPDGSIWLATDTGIDEIIRNDSHLQVGRVLSGSSFVIAVGPQGRLWSSFGTKGVRVTDPANRSFTTLNMPPVDTIVSDSAGSMWIGTEAGLYRVEDRPGVPLQPVQVGTLRTSIPAVIDDGSGGVFYISGNRLRHLHQDQNDVAVAGPWPTDGFEPITLAVGHDHAIWIGGPGGLFRFVLVNDHVSFYQPIPTTDIQSNTVPAVMVDHRGWVWVGTTLGISVFNGQRWVSVDADGGLLSNDVDQGGIREDPDGSMWIVTSRGLSHLLDPNWLFTDHPIKALISGAFLGVLPVTGGSLPYSDAALSVQFGTPNYGAERSILFRYHLAGVDADWAESSSGIVRYPFVPPGRHLLTVVSYDKLTHRSSPPTDLMIDIAYPWWRRWWSEALWVLSAIGLVYAAMRLRFWAILVRQAELQRHVAVATEQLRYQAAHDSLTGLLNRSEVERRLAAKLSSGPIGGEMIVALIDIDHFKHVNDRHGHLGGDDVLRSIGRLVAGIIRDGEHAGRYGGEEILLVLQDNDGAGATRVLNLHRAVRDNTFSAAGTVIRLTCSIGLSWAVPGDDWESLVGRADTALYEAKEAGRDRVVESRLVDPGKAVIAARRPTPGF